MNMGLLLLLLAASPVREMQSQAIAVGGQKVPLFRHGHLVTYPPVSGPVNSFSVFGPGGGLQFEKTIQLDGHTSISDVDVDTDGSAAVAASAVGNGGCNLHGIVLLDRVGRQTTFIDTGCFVVARVAIAPDHAIWTIGFQRDSGRAEEDQQDYMIARQYTFDGNQARAFLPRSSFPKGLPPAAPGSAELFVTQDRLGLLVGANREWIELDLGGLILGRVRLAAVAGPTMAAFTQDNRVFFQGAGHGTLFTLTSQGLTAVPNQGPTLMGADGTQLVYRGVCCGAIKLQWFDQP
jgi:hypothetical protein